MPLRFFLFLPFFLAACSTITPKNVRQEPGFHKSDFSEILVLYYSASRVSQMVFEQAFVHELNQKGKKAQPGFSAFEDDLPNRPAIAKYVRSAGVRYVLITYPSSLAIEQASIAPASTVMVSDNREITSPAITAGLSHALDSYWGQGAFISLKNREGLQDNSISADFIVDIYDVKSGNRVWQATFPLQNPDSLSDAAAKMARQMLKHMH